MTTYVLVHGAWHSGAELKPTAAPIRAAGHEGHRLVQVPGSHECFSNPKLPARAIMDAGRD